MITTKTLYKVPNLFEKRNCFLSDLLCGLWCTNTLDMEDIKQMDFYKETQYNDQCNDISGKLIDDSIKDCFFSHFWTRFIMVMILKANILRLHGMN